MLLFDGKRPDLRTYLDCIACIVNQSVNAPKLFTDDTEIRERIVRQTLREVEKFDMRLTPPEMGGILNSIINRALGIPDPYLKDKQRFNNLALSWLPELREIVAKAPNPFAAAVRLAIAANVIDFGAPFGKTGEDVLEVFKDAQDRHLKGAGAAGIDHLRELAKESTDILYLADNAGEIVIDRLLIDQLDPGKVTVVVREGPAINDALIEDALAAGLGDCAQIITSGVALPGTPLHRCPTEFVQRFQKADLIISKGQGNYETLSEHEGSIVFLLVAKCHTVAAHLGCSVGDFVIA